MHAQQHSNLSLPCCVLTVLISHQATQCLSLGLLMLTSALPNTVFLCMQSPAAIGSLMGAAAALLSTVLLLRASQLYAAQRQYKASVQQWVCQLRQEQQHLLQHGVHPAATHPQPPPPPATGRSSSTCVRSLDRLLVSAGLVPPPPAPLPPVGWLFHEVNQVCAEHACDVVFVGMGGCCYMSLNLCSCGQLPCCRCPRHTTTG